MQALNRCRLALKLLSSPILPLRAGALLASFWCYSPHLRTKAFCHSSFPTNTHHKATGGFG